MTQSTADARNLVKCQSNTRGCLFAPDTLACISSTFQYNLARNNSFGNLSIVAWEIDSLRNRTKSVTAIFLLLRSVAINRFRLNPARSQAVATVPTAFIYLYNILLSSLSFAWFAFFARPNKLYSTVNLCGRQFWRSYRGSCDCEQPSGFEAAHRDEVGGRVAGRKEGPAIAVSVTRETQIWIL